VRDAQPGPPRIRATLILDGSMVSAAGALRANYVSSTRPRSAGRRGLRQPRGDPFALQSDCHLGGRRARLEAERRRAAGAHGQRDRTRRARAVPPGPRYLLEFEKPGTIDRGSRPSTAPPRSMRRTRRRTPGSAARSGASTKPHKMRAGSSRRARRARRRWRWIGSCRVARLRRHHRARHRPVRGFRRGVPERRRPSAHRRRGNPRSCPRAGAKRRRSARRNRPQARDRAAAAGTGRRTCGDFTASRVATPRRRFAPARGQDEGCLVVCGLTVDGALESSTEAANWPCRARWCRRRRATRAAADSAPAPGARRARLLDQLASCEASYLRQNARRARRAPARSRIERVRR